jgi:hypothetical protein
MAEYNSKLMQLFTQENTCLKCDSHNIAVQKEGLLNKLARQNANLLFPVRFLTGASRAPQLLHVCRDCEFSW